MRSAETWTCRLFSSTTTPGHTAVLNGRYTGGYITRHYADVARGVEAVQLEVSQRNYMDEDSFAYDAGKAAVLQAVIGNLLRATLA